MKQKQETKKGVSLIELLTVLAIIVTLIAISLVEYQHMDDKAQRNGSLVSAKGFALALKMYKLDKGTYTCSMTDLFPYANITTLKNSFLTAYFETGTGTGSNCTFQNLTLLRVSAQVKGITPVYSINYYLVPQQDPECRSTGGTFYPCGQKW